MTEELLHQMLLDHLSTAIVLLDHQLSIKHLNPAAEALLASSEAQLSGTSVYPLFENPESAAEILRNSLQNMQVITRRQTKMQRSDQSMATVDLTISPIEADDELLLLLEMQPMDRVMRISREEALISANDTTRNLVRGLAHEIKNPLGGIRGAAQLLSGELSNQSDLLEYTEVISAETDRLCRLVDQMLGPNQPGSFSLLNIHEVLEHIFLLVSAEVGNEIHFKRDYDPSIPELMGDREQLIQAIINVVNNAIRALKSEANPEPTLTFKTSIQRQFTIGKRFHRALCRLDICDNGPGIPEDFIDSIFYPMISGFADGTGLGLPLAQSVLNRHHGLIECKSEPGNTCFSLYLPLQNGDNL